MLNSRYWGEKIKDVYLCSIVWYYIVLWSQKIFLYWIIIGIIMKMYVTGLCPVCGAVRTTLFLCLPGRPSGLMIALLHLAEEWGGIEASYRLAQLMIPRISLCILNYILLRRCRCSDKMNSWSLWGPIFLILLWICADNLG